MRATLNLDGVPIFYLGHPFLLINYLAAFENLCSLYFLIHWLRGREMGNTWPIPQLQVKGTRFFFCLFSVAVFFSFK